MEIKTLTPEDNFYKFSKILKKKLNNGFTIVERNDKLPFAVLSKKGKKVNHNFNFLISCITFGLWSLPWFYLWCVSYKDKVILIALDEDGKPFEDKCFN